MIIILIIFLRNLYTVNIKYKFGLRLTTSLSVRTCKLDISELETIENKLIDMSSQRFKKTFSAVFSFQIHNFDDITPTLLF